MPVHRPIWCGTTGLVYAPGSGVVNYGERVTLTDILMGPYTVCLANAPSRGTFGSGSRLGWVVTSARVEPGGKGPKGILTINWEAGGLSATAPLPIDEFTCDPTELYPRVERNKLFNQTSTGAGAMADIDVATCALAYQVIHGSTKESKDSAYQSLLKQAGGPPGPATDQGALGLVLADKLRKGEETYYIAGFKYIWSAFSYAIPTLSKGAIVQDPYGPGSIPDSLPTGISWLRLADSLAPNGVNGSMWKNVRTWIGGPAGHWDSDLYS
jgi:hypothetical protein